MTSNEGWQRRFEKLEAWARSVGYDPGHVHSERTPTSEELDADAGERGVGSTDTSQAE